MTKEFARIEIDFNRCRDDLVAFKSLLDEFDSGTLGERRILAFFREHQNLAALVGHVDRNIGRVDRLAYEFDLFGDYAADLVVGDSSKREYCFVEFEAAAPDSIFKKVGKKTTLEWSPRFDHGYSQLIDWLWKLHDMATTDSGRARFGHLNSFNYYGLLVVGRSKGLSPLEQERLNWRRRRVVVDSRMIHCMTFDELHEDLSFQLDRYGPAALADVEESPRKGRGAGPVPPAESGREGKKRPSPRSTKTVLPKEGDEAGEIET
jgi:hypothetical protein